MTVESKRCRRCGLVKPASAYWKSKITEDGLYWYCKACELERCEDRRRAAGHKKRIPKPLRKKLTISEKMTTALNTLHAVHLALRLAEAGQLDADLLKATRQMVKQTLDLAK